MAFDKTGLMLVGGSKAGNAPQMWTYKTNDTAGTVDTAGYFDNGSTTNTGMRNVFRLGDLIYVHANAAGTTPTYGLHIVTQISTAGIIDVTNATALGGTDSD
jgi:hypothetical protein